MPDPQRSLFLSAPILGLLALLVLSCTPEQPSAPPGSLMQDQISYELAVYYPGAPARDPIPLLEDLLKEEGLSGFRRVESLEVPDQGMAVAARWITDAQSSYPPPDAESLTQYSGRGLTPDQAASVARTNLALVLSFGYRREHVWEGAKTATRLLSRLAHESGGVIWDGESRETFAPEAWDEQRLDLWKEEIPVLWKQFTIHAYQDGELVRCISLGLAKFGLPDLVIEEASWAQQKKVGGLINLLAQALAEGKPVGNGGEIVLDLKAIKNPQIRDPQLQSLKDNATGVARLTLREGSHQEGDPENRLFEIAFDQNPGEDAHARQEAALSSFFGWEDSTQRVDHDKEVLAASRRAREKLPTLREAFNRGLEPGEYILLKAPFENQEGGREWMWVEVTSWNGNDIKGLLRNQPETIPELQAGQAVKVSEEDVFDYIRRYPGGKEEGNETSAALDNSAARKQGS